LGVSPGSLTLPFRGAPQFPFSGVFLYSKAFLSGNGLFFAPGHSFLSDGVASTIRSRVNLFDVLVPVSPFVNASCLVGGVRFFLGCFFFSNLGPQKPPQAYASFDCEGCGSRSAVCLPLVQWLTGVVDFVSPRAQDWFLKTNTLVCTRSWGPHHSKDLAAVVSSDPPPTLSRLRSFLSLAFGTPFLFSTSRRDLFFQVLELLIFPGARRFSANFFLISQDPLVVVPRPSLPAEPSLHTPLFDAACNSRFYTVSFPIFPFSVLPGGVGLLRLYCIDPSDSPPAGPPFFSPHFYLFGQDFELADRPPVLRFPDRSLRWLSFPDLLPSSPPSSAI